MIHRRGRFLSIPRLKTLDRYLLKEVSSSFFFGIFIFLAIFLVDILMELIDYIISKGIATEVVMRLFLYALPAVLVLVIPMAMLFSTLIGLGRLSTDNEITAMKAGGIHFFRIVASVAILGLVMTGVTIFLNEVLVPRANYLRRDIYKRVILKRPLPKVAENVFFEGGKNRIFYVRSYRSKNAQMNDVSVYESRRNRHPNIIDARIGKWMDDRWGFEDGVLREFDDFGTETRSGTFQKMILPADSNYGQDDSDWKSPREKSFLELSDEIQRLRRNNVDTRNLEVELWAKTSLPFACAVFVLIGAPLAITPSRSGTSIGMGLSILIIFVYYILMSAGRALGEGGYLPPVLGAWLPNLITGLLGLALIYHYRK